MTTDRDESAWRVGRHYGIHVYEVRADGDDRPVATFHRPEDARQCVEDHAARPDPAAWTTDRDHLLAKLREIHDDERDWSWLANELMPTVQEIVARQLETAADTLESEAEQPRLNHLADTIYRPGFYLSAIWLRDRAATLRNRTTA